MTASYEVRGQVAVITLNNPPVIGLGYETRKATAEGIARANNDAAIKAIVLTGAGKAFSGGADIREFGSPKALAEPNLLSLIKVVENSGKPSTACAWAAVWSWRWAATTAWRRRARRWRCLRSSWAWCPGPAARSGCRVWWAWKWR